MTTVIGIDPGGNETGIILAQDKQLLNAWSVERKSLEYSGYIREILKAIEDLEKLIVENSYLIAVEGLICPDEMPWLGKKKFGGIMNTAIVLGAVLGRYPSAVVIPPGGNGAAPFQAYSEGLQPPQGAKGFDILRHCRSAWDVGQAGLAVARMTAK